jgi:hypothetical protein
LGEDQLEEEELMAWEQWILPIMLLGGVGGLYYLMAKKGIGCCGSMMSSGCGMGMEKEGQESHQRRTEAGEPARNGEGSPRPPAAPARTRQGVLVGRGTGHPQEG